MRPVSKGIIIFSGIVFFSLFAINLILLQSVSQEIVPEITIEDLKPMLGKPDVVIIDVRIQNQWEAADQKIPGAVHENPGKDVKLWLDKYPKDKTIVLY